MNQYYISICTVALLESIKLLKLFRKNNNFNIIEEIFLLVLKPQRKFMFPKMILTKVVSVEVLLGTFVKDDDDYEIKLIIK